MTNKTALVTGAEGFIGSHLVRFLAAQQWTVIAGYRRQATPAPQSLANLRYAECDLRNQAQLEHLLQTYAPTHVFHLAAQSVPEVSREDPIDTFESNIMGSLYLFEAIRLLRRHPVVIAACSSAEYGHVPASRIPVREAEPLHPLHPYGISKMCLELLARQYYLDHRIPTVSLRIFNTTGPGKVNDAPSDFVRQLVQIKHGRQAPILKVGNLKSRRAFLHVNDTVNAFYRAASKGRRGEVYNICAGSAIAIGELLRMAMRLSGVQPEIHPVRELMRPSDENIILGSTRKFHRDTGWRPVTSLGDTLADMLEYWEHHAMLSGK